MSLFGNIGKFFKKSWDNISSGKWFSDFGKNVLNPKNWFSDYDGDMGLFGTGFGDFQDFWDDYTGRGVAKDNLDLQQAQFDYQKQLNDLQMMREDTAYQRKVKDMTAAGFNPILAASGSGSPSTALHAGPAPQMADTSGAVRDSVGQVVGLMQGIAGMRKLNAETSLLKSQKDYQDIVNKHEDSLRTLKVESETLSNKLASGTLDLRIHSFVQDIELKDKELINRDLDNALKRFDVDNLDLEKVRRQLINSGLDLKNQSLDNEITLKGIAILQKWAEYNQYEFQSKVMNKYGLWAGFNGGEFGNLALMLTESLMTGVDLIGGIGGEFFKRLVGLCGFGNGDTGSTDKPYTLSKSEIRRLLKRPEGSNWLWTKNMNKTADYGVRRNF